MERLTEKITNSKTENVLAYRLKREVDRIKAMQKLGEYEDAEEQGLLLRLPCKVGDAVYFPKYDYHDSAIITQIEIDKQGIIFYWAQYEYGVDVTELWDDGYFSIDEIGKTVFPIREQAEQAMKETKKCKHVKDNGLCGKNPACTSSGKCERYCSYFEQALKQMGEQKYEKWHTWK